MAQPDKIDTRIYPGLEELSEAAAEALVSILQAAIEQRDRFTMALSGGNTARYLYGLLATTYRAVIPWRKVQLFWGDERYLPPEDPRSNYRMAKEALLEHIAIPRDNVHPMPTLLPEIEEAAEAYEETLMSYFTGQWPRFDLILLGMGPDGHVASLFPHNAVLDEEARVVAAVQAEADPPRRLTLTLPAINHAANVHFLVAGREKAAAVKLAFAPRATVAAAPASGIRPAKARSSGGWTRPRRARYTRKSDTCVPPAHSCRDHSCGLALSAPTSATCPATAAGQTAPRSSTCRSRTPGTQGGGGGRAGGRPTA